MRKEEEVICRRVFNMNEEDIFGDDVFDELVRLILEDI